MEWMGIITFLTSPISSAIGGVGLYFTVQRLKQIRTQFELGLEWNRKKAAQDALMQVRKELKSDLLASEFDYANRKQVLSSEEVQHIKNMPELQNELHNMLNVYEALCRGVEKGVFDEELIKLGRSNAMRRSKVFFQAYIDERRADVRGETNSKAWRFYTDRVEAWEEQGWYQQNG